MERNSTSESLHPAATPACSLAMTPRVVRSMEICGIYFTGIDEKSHELLELRPRSKLWHFERKPDVQVSTCSGPGVEVRVSGNGDLPSEIAIQTRFPAESCE